MMILTRESVETAYLRRAEEGGAKERRGMKYNELKDTLPRAEALQRAAAAEVLSYPHPRGRNELKCEDVKESGQALRRLGLS